MDLGLHLRPDGPSQICQPDSHSFFQLHPANESLHFTTAVNRIVAFFGEEAGNAERLMRRAVMSRRDSALPDVASGLRPPGVTVEHVHHAQLLQLGRR